MEGQCRLFFPFHNGLLLESTTQQEKKKLSHASWGLVSFGGDAADIIQKDYLKKKNSF